VSLSGGQVTYTPDVDYNGAASFTYTVSDNGTTNRSAERRVGKATVNVTVSEVNDAPTAVDDNKTTAEDTTLTFAASDLTTDDSASVAEDGSVAIDVRANDTKGPANEAGQTLAVSAVGTPTHGTAAVIASGPNAGTVLYTPAADYNGPDAFTYTVSDNGTTN